MSDPTKIIRVDSLCPDETLISKAGKILSQNGIVIFPAQCLYGVAANALNPHAVEKVFQIKERPKHNPILVLIRDRSMLTSLVKSIPESAEKLMDRFWPGNLTLVFEAKQELCPILTAGTNKIGIRVPGHPIAQALVKSVGFPITGTSANLSGQPGCTTPKDLPPSIIESADLVLDAGPVKGGTGSTIADLTGEAVKILREGAVPSADIFRSLD